MPLIAVAVYIVILTLMVGSGHGPAAVFARDLVSQNSNVVASAEAFVHLNRAVLLPLLVLVIGVMTARLTAAAAGVVTTAATAAIIGGYPSWVLTLFLALAYAALGLLGRAMRRRRWPVRT
jgi:hypothetical protein